MRHSRIAPTVPNDVVRTDIQTEKVHASIRKGIQQDRCQAATGYLDAAGPHSSGAFAVRVAAGGWRIGLAVDGIVLRGIGENAAPETHRPVGRFVGCTARRRKAEACRVRSILYQLWKQFGIGFNEQTVFGTYGIICGRMERMSERERVCVRELLWRCNVLGKK
jgi:hypothetical protein